MDHLGRSVRLQEGAIHSKLRARRLLLGEASQTCAFARDIAMTVTLRSIATAAATAVLVCVAAVPRAAAQAHVQEGGDYVLRASTASAVNLPEKMRDQYGIGTQPNTAVLNITVQQRNEGVLRNVPARLDVRARNLYGVETSVNMQEVMVNDFVSYMGTYRFLPREVLDFRVIAHPQGDQQQPITLEFRDRLGLR